ncbi:hypothetical protein NQ317_005862 [Molorchus minor]|uniref:Ataxin-10 n=1 Tax=Molorchus minor TaxID=1323400 RepID=A0ABQ9IYC1_9CUCU|nr:hypothetical protein NQ317_005862 [Molorchus minor]
MVLEKVQDTLSSRMCENLILYAETTENKKVISCDREVLLQIRNKDSGQWKKFLSHLKKTFKVDTCLNGTPKPWHYKKLQESDEGVIEVITEILRSLRNSVSNKENQKYVVEDTNILSACYQIFLVISERDQNSICLKILLQFLINLITSNREAAEKINTMLFEKIKKGLKNGIHLYETSALIYNISLLVPINDMDLLSTIFEKYNSEEYNEFQFFFLEKCLANIGEITENDERIYEISLILEILSSLSGDDHYLTLLQNNKDLFINAGILLINVHKLGKQSFNCFTPVKRLSEFKNESELKNHPAFGFKTDLVRLIGNLCWRNTEMQNLKRTAEIIPVILDCCNMDARNPFIIQWAIFAIRNLSENNPENQKIIEGLHQEGVVSSEVLDELGLTLNRDGDDYLNIVPLDSLGCNCKI